MRKLNTKREETWRYTGEVLEHLENGIIIQAFFNRDDSLFHGIFFKRGDRFVETFYSDRWYNIFEMHDRDDDHLKGWYCNVGLPAEIQEDTISYVDLALDLLVYPGGSQLVLDEDEFAQLHLPPETVHQAKHALIALQEHFKQQA